MYHPSGVEIGASSLDQDWLLPLVALLAALAGFLIASFVHSRRAPRGLEQVALEERPDTPREHGLRAQLGRLRTKDAASQVSLAKLDRFLSTLAHELRGPLAPLLVATDQLQTLSDASRVARKLAGIAHRQVVQLHRLVEDVCDMNRVNHGHLSIRLAPVELQDVLLEAAEAVEPLTELKGQHVEVRIDPGPFFVFGDSARLVQVMFNLLSNASRYSPEGASIGLGLTRSGDQAVLTVQDSGIGVSEDNLHHIFELFSQVAPLSEGSRDGFGIGLALVQELVGLHSGRVEASSDGLGRGSTFRVFLGLEPAAVRRAPLSKSSAPSIVPASYLSPANAPALVRSVVVDDEVDQARVLAAALEAVGVDVRLAHDGIEALSTIETFKPHVVFMDLALPRLSGQEVARRIRAERWGRSVRLVAVSGRGRLEDQVAALAGGFDAHLTKPVELDDLQRLVAAGARA